MKYLKVLQLIAIIGCLFVAVVYYFTEDIQKATWYLLVALTNYILWRDNK